MCELFYKESVFRQKEIEPSVRQLVAIDLFPKFLLAFDASPGQLQSRFSFFKLSILNFRFQNGRIPTEFCFGQVCSPRSEIMDVDCLGILDSNSHGGHRVLFHKNPDSQNEETNRINRC